MKLSLLILPLLTAAIPQPRESERLLSTSNEKQRLLVEGADGNPDDGPSPKLNSMLRAIKVMQDEYFYLFSGTWPTAIDWTAAVVGTQVSASLSSVVSSFPPVADTCVEAVWWQNTIEKYFAHTSFFYFGENAFALRNQAFDDMLWVVLGWLENIKFSAMYSRRHFGTMAQTHAAASGWHGLQFSPMAAHRARVFYDLASEGWDESLCHGGMNWNPYLAPYKNAITNELYAAASIAMYLYFPGDNNSAPFLQHNGPSSLAGPHDPQHLENAIKAYKWLQDSHMTNRAGLYQDGFHVTGWHRYPNGTVDHGTGECDDLSSMVYTYNQGVILSASRGLWLATGARSYLDDGHNLIENVIRATGWPWTDTRSWRGLGRGGVLEEYCDHRGQCSQDGQTFKGIFFWHLGEFCRPLWDTEQEEEYFATSPLHTADVDRVIYQYHLDRCAAYGKWIEHNAAAAEATLDSHGRFGMWWTTLARSPTTDQDQDQDQRDMQEIIDSTQLPPGAVDGVNPQYEQGPAPITKQGGDINDRGRGRTVETQAGGLAVLRARWNWNIYF